MIEFRAELGLDGLNGRSSAGLLGLKSLDERLDLIGGGLRTAESQQICGNTLRYGCAASRAFGVARCPTVLPAREPRTPIAMRWQGRHSRGSQVQDQRRSPFGCGGRAVPSIEARNHAASISRSSCTENGGDRRCATEWQFGQSGMRSTLGSMMYPGPSSETGVT